MISALLIQTTAFASILGSESITEASLGIADGAVLHTNSFFSDQTGVGLQTENYVEYTPNSNTVPVVASDRYLYGKRTVSQMASSLMNSGIYPVMMMNSDFFSLQTGVPMSHQVEDGVLVTKDTQILDSVGINADGTAFIAPLQINTSITVGENTVSIDNFNKYRQPYVIYMLNDKFSSTTEATDPGLNVIIGSLSGDITLGSSITGVVESVVESEGAIAIPEGKIVLTADNRVPTEIYEQLKLFNEGDTVTINTTADGDARWNDAKYILGCFGGRIIKDGEITEVDDSAAPRTAFGIKEDGSLIFYTIDGRQTGHSYGVRLQTLAKRLKELGCVDAVNLDGGGSTGIGTIYPGNDNFTVVNKPSDGSERKVSTFIGLYNSAKSTGKAEKLFMYPYSGNYLSGATQSFNVLATDSGYYKTPTPSQLLFTAPDGTQSSDPDVTITGNGKVRVTVSGDEAKGEVYLNCYDTPSDIVLYNQDSNKSVTSLNIKCADSVNLSATAWVGNKKLIGDDSCFEWKADGAIGTVDSNGYFTASDEPGSGKITVSAGGFKKEFDVNITADTDSYTEISFEYTAPGQVTVNFTTPGGVGLKEENITIKADGKEVNASLEGNLANLVFADSMSHKISVTATNNAALTTTAFYTINGIEYGNIFADTENHWAKKYIAYMNNQGIVNGSTEEAGVLFRPSANVTRAEFAVMVANLLGTDVSQYENIKLNTDDADSVPAWAANHVKALSELGIMQGRQSGDKVLFEPSAQLTRSEAVTVLSRILPENIKVNKNIDFTDKADIPSWSLSAFERLCSLGVVSGYEDGSVKPTGKITRAEAVKLLYEIY